jgi:hypothetical protein
LTQEQRQYVVRSVVRILKDVNRDDIIAALKDDVLAAADEGEAEDLELDLVVVAVAEACRERLRARKKAAAATGEEPAGG